MFKSTGSKFVFSGLFLKLVNVFFCSFYILRFIEPFDLGEWHKFTVFFLML